MAFPFPPDPFVMGHAVDGTELTARLYMPDPLVYGDGPYPGICGTVAGGFDTGGAGVSNDTMWDWALHGYVAMFFDVRLVKTSGQHGLPGQVSDGKYQEQTDDMAIGIEYLRAHEDCNGFVAVIGGSGSGHHATWKCAVGDIGGDRPDAGVALSPATDFSDRSQQVLDNPGFQQKTIAYARVSDLPTLLARSPVSQIDATMVPLFFNHGQHENMPWTQHQLLIDALDDAGVTNYTAVETVADGGARHSWGCWAEVKNGAFAFIDAAYAAWNGGSGGGLKAKPRGLYSLMAGGTVDITGKPGLTNDSVVGFRGRFNWDEIQPDEAATFDWSCIDDPLALCTANGKKLALSVSAGVFTPDWVYTTGTNCTKYELLPPDQNDDDHIFMPMPWQIGFYGKFETFLNALGARYDANPFISYIYVTGFMQSAAFNFVEAGIDETNAIAVGDGFDDTFDAIVPAAKAIIDMWGAAFPTTPLILTLTGDLIPGQQGATAKTEIRDYGEATFPGQFGRQFNGLRGVPPPHSGPDDYPIYPNIRQMINPSGHAGVYDPPDPDPYPSVVDGVVFRDMALRGWGDNRSEVIEIYEPDIANTNENNQRVLRDVHSLLVPGAPPLESGYRMTLTGGPYTIVGASQGSGLPDTCRNCTVKDLGPEQTYNATLVRYIGSDEAAPATTSFTSDPA